MFSMDTKYEALTSLDGEDLNVEPRASRPFSQLRHRHLLEAFILFVSLASLIFSFITLSDRDYCTRKVFMPSPALDVFDDSSFRPHRFNGTFWEPGRFKGPPSPDIDRAWNEITYANGGVIRVDRQQLNDAQASEYVVQFREEMGGGYMASVESLHQLHCLNMLRQATYEDYYRDKALSWTDSPNTLRHHLDHCIDNLRQKLMCDADAGLVTYVWVKGHKYPFPDFNVVHKCRDFQQLLDWTHAHNMYNKYGVDVGRVEGALELDVEP